MIKGSLVSKRGFKLKKNLGVLSSNLREDVVQRMSILHVSIMARNFFVSVYWLSVVVLDVEKDRHKVRYCPNRYGKKVAPSVPKHDAPTKRRFYALQTRGESRMRVMMMLLSPRISL